MSAPAYPYSLTSEDRLILESLRVPIPSNEAKRIETLRRSKILDEELRGAPFDRFTSLATRLFGMPYAALTFVEVDQVYFKSKIGFELGNIHRNDWFDAYAILPDASEVFVVADCALDRRFKDKRFVRASPHIRFFAGAAIILDDVRLGVLSIMDTEPHPQFTLEDKENLLDLGAAVAQLAGNPTPSQLLLRLCSPPVQCPDCGYAGEKLQTALNLSAERANIVVSMMHHLRTPMTSLNFATSLLCSDVQTMNGRRATNNAPTPAPAGGGGAEEGKDQTLQSFESSFHEIHASLNQLNVLVDSSLSLGQAIIKCSSNETPTERSKFSECNLLDYLADIFHNSLPAHKHSLEVEWNIDCSALNRGTHVTFPDAIMLVLISTFSHMSTEADSLGYYFSFTQTDEDNLEYPELVNKMLEGNLSIKVFAKDASKAVPAPSPASPDAPSAPATPAAVPEEEMPSKQNFLSIDKIIRAINGSAREVILDISTFCKGQGYRNVQEFFVPCKILLTPTARGSNSMRLYRPASVVESSEQPVEITISPRTQTTPPMSIPRNTTPRNTTTPSSLSVAPTGDRSGLRVLVIEDTVPVQKLLAKWLGLHGCSVTCANNGKVGLELLQQNTFDITFVDFLMPVMLGITTMKHFQSWLTLPTSSQANRELLIVGMSATALESEQEEAFSYGMHFFCPKPVSLDLLGIILEAKRDCPSNDLAVEQICEVTGTNMMEKEEEDRRNAVEQQLKMGSSLQVAEESVDIQAPADSTPDGNYRAKWNIFRSHKQVSKVSPETFER